MATRAEPQDAGAGRRLHREVSSVGLLFVSLGTIIGSGWLFGALTSAQIAGPAAIISWVLGAIVMLVLALVHAELGSMYPVAGGSTRYPHFSFGSVAGFVIGWAVWLGAVTVAPIEVLAALQYLTHYFTFLTNTTGGVTVLTDGHYHLRNTHVRIHRHQPNRYPPASGVEQHNHDLEGRDPLPGGRGHNDPVLQHLQLHRRRRLRPVRDPGRVECPIRRGNNLLLPGLRAGHPARSRDPQPAAQHSVRRHRVDGDRGRPVHPAAGRFPWCHRSPRRAQERVGEPLVPWGRRSLRRAGHPGGRRLAGDAPVHRRLCLPGRYRPYLHSF